ncbi:hypothetical protein COO60DRAFT_753213 [Scenedesmus sp. NREL 46B-D3]|nr:hypothetical protein COO60DRAFT_753213 [Scenedesmus sp. NREL 46B-D3]
MPTPRLTITTFPVEIKPPTFSLPTLNLPTNFSLPAPLQALAKIANFTALNLDLSDLNFTLPSLPTLQLDEPHPGLALLSSLPSILKFDRPVTNMSVPDVLAQWLAATVSKATLPRIVVPTARVNALKALIPGFTAPSVVMPTYLSAVLSKVPASLELPSFSIPGKTLPSVSLLLPNLTSLPSIVVPADMPKELRLPPLLTMHNVSLPTLQQLARNFVDSLPSVEVSFNVPDILAQWVAGVVQASPLQQLNVSDSGLVKLQELLPDMPDKGPALLLLNISSPFLAQPVVKELVNLPTVVIPDSLIGNVSAVLPTLTSLPSILHNLPTTLNMTQGITDWLDTHTSLLGDAAEGSNASAAADVAGGLSLGAAHPMVGAGLAAAVEQLAGAGADVPVKAALGSGAPAAADDDAAAAGAPATAGDAAAAAAAGAPAAAGDAGDAADAPVAAVAAGAPLEEAEVEAA